MAIPILNHLDLRNVSELQNATLHTTTRASASHKAGKIIFEQTGSSPNIVSAVYVSDGAAWFDLSGDIKQVKVTADDGNEYDVTTGNFDFTISGDTGISTTLSGSTLEIDLDDTAVTPNSYGSATAIPTFTVDQQGRLTAAGSESIATALTVDGDSGAQNVDLLTDDLQILGTANEIETAVTKPAVGGNPGTDVKVIIGLPSDVTIGNDLTVTNDLSVSVNAAVTGNLSVDGISNLDNTDIDGTLVVDGSNISLDSTSTLNIDNSNTTNGITIGTATTSVPISIGHTTSEVTVNDNLTVIGNLTVSGSTTTKISETVLIEDNIITLNSNESGDPTENSGILVERGNSTDVDLIWNETSDRWTFTNDGSTHYNIPVSDEYGSGRQFTTLIGDGSATTINLKNSTVSVTAPDKNLTAAMGNDSSAFMIQLVEVSTGLTVFADVVRGAAGLVTMTFSAAPANNGIRVLITKIG